MKFCRRGHPLDNETMRQRADGTRCCKVCEKLRARARRARAREKEKLPDQQRHLDRLAGKLPDQQRHLDRLAGKRPEWSYPDADLLAEAHAARAEIQRNLLRPTLDPGRVRLGAFAPVYGEAA